MFTRRTVIQYAFLATPLLPSLKAASHNQFWNTKDPADWNEKETSEILNHSPWAKHAIVDSGADDHAINSRDNGAATRSPGSAGNWGGGGMGQGGGMGAGGGMSQGGGMGAGGSMGQGTAGGISTEARDAGMPRDSMPPKPQFDVVVRWESAAPVAAALKKPLPDAAKFYILSMSGLPLRQANSRVPEADRRAGIEEAFKQASSLQRKGEDPILPDRVELIDQTLRFSFARDSHPITAGDKEVIFATAFGRASIKAKFSPKDMTYRDQLAI